MPYFARRVVFAAAISISMLVPQAADGLDRVEFRAGDRPQSVSGKVLAATDDGGLLVLGRDGRIWPIKADDLLDHRQSTDPFEPYTAVEFTERLRDEFGLKFQVYATNHYLICHSTSLDYARWCEHLFERLYRAFTTYWKKRGFPIQDPPFPLVAIVFEDREAYEVYGRREVGDGIENIIGFYSLETNRIALYDPRPQRTREKQARRRETTRRRNQVLAQATGAFNVATIVHEATHQLAFNSGFHRRFADNPLWLTEGMALYFETPDSESDDGWKEMGRVNAARLTQFRRGVARGRSPTALRDLVASDEGLRNPATALDSYAEAWALSYFLIRTKPEQYHAYLRKLNAKPVLVWDSAEQRLADFLDVFGRDLKRLDEEFVRYMTERGLR